MGYMVQRKEEVNVRDRRTPTEVSGDSATPVPVQISRPRPTGSLRTGLWDQISLTGWRSFRRHLAHSCQAARGRGAALAEGYAVLCAFKAEDVQLQRCYHFFFASPLNEFAVSVLENRWR